MDLKNVQLPSSLLVSLYNGLLVDQAPAAKAVAPAAQHEGQARAIRFLGGNGRQVCLLVSHEKLVHLPDADLQFLTSILQACRLGLADVAIVNVYGLSLSLPMLRASIPCQKIIVFGIGPDALGLAPTPDFTVVDYEDAALLYAPEAAILNAGGPESKQLKSKLWASLKQLFGV